MKLANRRLALNANATIDEQPLPLSLPAVSDAASIQRAIAVVLQAVAEGTLEAPRARVLLYGLQIAATNARRIVADTPVKPIEPEVTAPQPVVSKATSEDATIEAVDEDLTALGTADRIVEKADEPMPSHAYEASADTHAEIPKAAAPVIGYISPGRRRMLAFRNRSAL